MNRFLLKPRDLTFLQKRWRGKKLHWAVLQRKKFNKDKALDHFDDFYGSVFGKQWKSMRIALLTEHKYIAFVNNFGDVEETSRQLELNGAINVKSLFEIASERLKTQKLDVPQIGNNPTMEYKIKEIARRQEQRELEELYPPNSNIPNTEVNEDIIEEKLKSNSNDGIKEEIARHKKSLSESLEDANFDRSRLIDASYGTGALYEYMPATKIKGKEDWIPESSHYKYYSNTADFPVTVELEQDFSFPENLHFYTYEKGNCSQFDGPRKCVTGVLSHFLLDGSSILPPLFLNIQPGDKVLDACAAPGGKSLIMLQTLYPDILVCNDLQESRANRIRNIMKQYICDYNMKWDNKRCFIAESDIRAVTDYETYDKILVDVPCTTDRHSVTENDNNIFKANRVKERLRLPELQSEILANCLRLLKPGGSLVYSTCSLSPIQNDGVVHMALQRVFNEHGITATIRDLSFLIKSFHDIFKFENPSKLKYGQLIIPYLPANFGPMYFSKIIRTT